MCKCKFNISETGSCSLVGNFTEIIREQSFHFHSNEMSSLGSSVIGNLGCCFDFLWGNSLLRFRDISFLFWCWFVSFLSSFLRSVLAIRFFLFVSVLSIFLWRSWVEAALVVIVLIRVLSMTLVVVSWLLIVVAGFSLILLVSIVFLHLLHHLLLIHFQLLLLSLSKENLSCNIGISKAAWIGT